METDIRDELRPHIIAAYRAAATIADEKDIKMLYMPVAEFLFLNFRKYSANKKIGVFFHGTNKEVLDSITTYGMLDPTSIKYNIKNGNAYGPGIYLSPNPRFSINYSSGCMIIALALEGVQELSIDSSNTLNRDSVTGGADIKVFRSTSQVLPVFYFGNKTLKNNKVNLTDDEIMDIIKYKMSEIVFDSNTVAIAQRIKEKDNTVRTSVIYNLLLKEDESEVTKKILELDYSEY
jgi:hypothetical protein